MFLNYVFDICIEMKKRKIKYQQKYLDEITDFCGICDVANLYYEEHNDRYLRQCYFNLQEKYDRGIITFDEWRKIKMAMLGELYE